MTREGVIAFAWIVGVLIGCDYFEPAGVRVDVGRNGNEYAIVPASCRGKPIGIHAIRVARLAEDAAEGRDDYCCHLEVPMSKSIHGEWRLAAPCPMVR